MNSLLLLVCDKLLHSAPAISRHRTSSGAAFQVLGYAIQAPAPPFPVMCVGYVINGFGIAIQVGGGPSD